MSRPTNTRPRRRTRSDDRKGAALVEFAVLMPMFLTLTLGAVEVITATHQTSQLAQALREGGRLATQAYATSDLTTNTLNEKVVDDIRAFLAAGGTDITELNVTITHADGSNEGSAFDLSDSDNNFELFALEATLPANVSLYGDWLPNGPSARLVFRAGRINSTLN
ncbi:MAG: TadE/TadG family type IV pilus assembly protein [Planctomycetota bacterium]